MELKDIKYCPSCGSDELNKKLKSTIKCEKCGSKIGVSNKKVWYEYTVKND